MEIRSIRKYQNRGYSKQLIDFAKSFNLPIKAIARNNSKSYFENQGFTDVNAKNPEGHDVLIWQP